MPVTKEMFVLSDSNTEPTPIKQTELAVDGPFFSSNLNFARDSVSSIAFVVYKIMRASVFTREKDRKPQTEWFDLKFGTYFNNNLILPFEGLRIPDRGAFR